MEKTKVIIVGGGAAGLGAAKTLGSNVDYLLIEGQDYLGGRIRTIDAAPNVVVDLGAQFIHGERNNLVYEICKSLNCILPDEVSSNDDILVLTSNQKEIDSEIMKKAIIIWEKTLEDARAKYGDETVPVDYPISDYIFEVLKERLTSSLSTSKEIINALIDYFNKSELIENGCFTLSSLSLAEYGSFEYLDGLAEYELKNGGYRPFISYMKSFIPDDNRVRLNTEVIRVKYLQDQHQLLVTIRHQNEKSEEQISTILCDHIIWTSSLGYLKENFLKIFSDEVQLIEQKKDAIDNLGFDTVNKVVLIYEESLWPKDIWEIILLHTEQEQLIELSKSIKDILNNEKIDLEVIKTIVEGIHKYSILPSTDIPVLICWFGGSGALLIEDLDENNLGQICHGVLCHYLNISSNLNQPTRIIKSEWHKNRFICGSYSYYSIKSSTKDGEQLRSAYSPDGISRVQFAGEAMHDKFYSTVHGALESGIREAKILLSIINK